MLNLGDVLALIGEGTGLLNTCYIDGTIFNHEIATSFRDNWAAIGFGKDISEPGM